MSQPDNTQPSGSNPISHFTVEYLGEQTSSNSCSRRDLGFTGHFAGKWYAIYGDTLWCSPGVSDPAHSAEGFHGMVRNSLSELTDDPLVVKDLHLNDDKPVKHQLQFVPFKIEWGESNITGFGGTGIVEVDRGRGVGALYYLVNNNEWHKGAGIATVELVNDIPTITKRHGFQGWWWNGDTCAKYGDVSTYRDPHSEYIYIFGNPPNNITDWPTNCYVYQARVKVQHVFELDEYEYWWGRKMGWMREILTEFRCDTAVMWGVGQGQIAWNEYFGTYIYVHLNGPTVALRTAPNPEGPWSADKEIFTAEPIDGGFVYAGVVFPHLDPSGKTLTIGYTNNNHIQVIKVIFA